MAKVEHGKVVDIEYILKLDDGEVVDATEGEPLSYLHGFDEIITGLEQSLVDRKVGDTFTVKIPAADAFGEWDEDLVDEVPRDQFPKDAELEEGLEITAVADDGTESTAFVAGIDGDVVYVDRNHPLAGEQLTYEVTVVSVRDATPEELAHGHAHGAEDDHHHHDLDLN